MLHTVLRQSCFWVGSCLVTVVTSFTWQSNSQRPTVLHFLAHCLKLHLCECVYKHVKCAWDGQRHYRIGRDDKWMMASLTYVTVVKSNRRRMARKTSVWKCLRNRRYSFCHWMIYNDGLWQLSPITTKWSERGKTNKAPNSRVYYRVWGVEWLKDSDHKNQNYFIDKFSFT